MTRRLLRLALMAALFVVAVPISAFAQTGTVIDWGPDSYAWETNYNTATHLTAPGSQLSAVGVINGFLGPLSAFNPNTPGTEYTYYISGFTTALGTVVTPGPTLSVYKTVYVGGNIQIWARVVTGAETSTLLTPAQLKETIDFLIKVKKEHARTVAANFGEMVDIMARGQRRIHYIWSAVRSLCRR